MTRRRGAGGDAVTRPGETIAVEVRKPGWNTAHVQIGVVHRAVAVVVEAVAALLGAGAHGGPERPGVQAVPAVRHLAGLVAADEIVPRSGEQAAYAVAVAIDPAGVDAVAVLVDPIRHPLRRARRHVDGTVVAVIRRPVRAGRRGAALDGAAGPRVAIPVEVEPILRCAAGDVGVGVVELAVAVVIEAVAELRPPGAHAGGVGTHIKAVRPIESLKQRIAADQVVPRHGLRAAVPVAIEVGRAGVSPVAVLVDAVRHELHRARGPRRGPHHRGRTGTPLKRPYKDSRSTAPEYRSAEPGPSSGTAPSRQNGDTFKAPLPGLVSWRFFTVLRDSQDIFDGGMRVERYGVGA